MAKARVGIDFYTNEAQLSKEQKRVVKGFDDAFSTLFKSYEKQLDALFSRVEKRAGDTARRIIPTNPSGPSGSRPRSAPDPEIDNAKRLAEARAKAHAAGLASIGAQRNALRLAAAEEKRWSDERTRWTSKKKTEQAKLTDQLTREIKRLDDEQGKNLNKLNQTHDKTTRQLIQRERAATAERLRMLRQIAKEHDGVKTGGKGGAIGLIGTGRNIFGSLPGGGGLANLMGSAGSGGLAGGAAAAATAGVTALVAGIGVSAKTFMDFQTSLKDMQAIIGATDEKAASLGNTARDLGKKWGIDATQGVESMKLIISALGPDVAANEAALRSMTDTTLMYAKAAGLDGATATDSLTVTLSQFGYATADAATKAEQMTRIANVLAAASKEGSAEIPQLAESMKVVGATAHEAGLSVEQTAAWIEMLAPAGIKGSEAGTAFRNALLKMSSGTTEANKELERYGASFHDINPKIHGMQGAMLNLSKIYRGIKDPVEQATFMQKMFGMENANAMAILMAAGPQVEDFTNKITGTSEASTMATTKMSAFSEKLNVIKARVMDVALGLGEKLIPIAERLLPTIERNIPTIERFASAFATVVGIVADAVGWIDRLLSSDVGTWAMRLINPLASVTGMAVDLINMVSGGGGSSSATPTATVRVDTPTFRASDYSYGAAIGLPGSTTPRAGSLPAGTPRSTAPARPSTPRTTTGGGGGSKRGGGGGRTKGGSSTKAEQLTEDQKQRLLETYMQVWSDGGSIVEMLARFKGEPLEYLKDLDEKMQGSTIERIEREGVEAAKEFTEIADEQTREHELRAERHEQVKQWAQEEIERQREMSEAAEEAHEQEQDRLRERNLTYQLSNTALMGSFEGFWGFIDEGWRSSFRNQETVLFKGLSLMIDVTKGALTRLIAEHADKAAMWVATNLGIASSSQATAAAVVAADAAKMTSAIASGTAQSSAALLAATTVAATAPVYVASGVTAAAAAAASSAAIVAANMAAASSSVAAASAHTMASQALIGPLGWLGIAAALGVIIWQWGSIKQSLGIGDGKLHGGLVEGGAQLIPINEDGRPEFVLNADAVSRFGVQTLEAMNRGKIGAGMGLGVHEDSDEFNYGTAANPNYEGLSWYISRSAGLGTGKGLGVHEDSDEFNYNSTNPPPPSASWYISIARALAAGGGSMRAAGGPYETSDEFNYAVGSKGEYSDEFNYNRFDPYSLIPPAVGTLGVGGGDDGAAALLEEIRDAIGQQRTMIVDQYQNRMGEIQNHNDHDYRKV